MSQFVAGISVTCFAASYLVGFVLEVCRLFFRSGIRRAIMLGFVGAGLVAQTLFLMQRAYDAASSPLSSSFDWYLVAAWLIVAAYFYWNYYYPHAAIGLFLLPLALAMILAAMFADREPFAVEPASKAWGIIHGVFLLLGTLAVSSGFAAGLMYLLQSYRLKRHLPPLSGLKMPSLETLENVNARMIAISAMLIGVGFIAGIILKVVGDRKLEELPWSDPVVLSTGIMWAWLIAAALFNALYVPARKGRKVAYLTVANFVFLAIALGVFMSVDTQHGGKKRGRPAAVAASTTSLPFEEGLT